MRPFARDQFDNLLGGGRGSNRPPEPLTVAKVEDDETFAEAMRELHRDRRHLKDRPGRLLLESAIEHAYSSYRRERKPTTTGWQALNHIGGAAGTVRTDYLAVVITAARRHLTAVAQSRHSADDALRLSHDEADRAVVRYTAQLLRAPADLDQTYTNLIGPRWEKFRGQAGNRAAGYVAAVEWVEVLAGCLTDTEGIRSDRIAAALVAALPQPSETGAGRGRTPPLS